MSRARRGASFGELRRRGASFGELRSRVCGMCGRTMWGTSHEGKEPVLECFGCRMRWRGGKMQTWREAEGDKEGGWTDVPEGKLAVFPPAGRGRP